MFESLQDGLSSALKSLRGRGKLSEANMRDGLRAVRTALLQADVSVSVVNDFVERVSEKAVGERVLNSLDPSQQVVGFVHEELIQLMGPVDHSLHLRPEINVLMLCGLQGSGKTTTCGKLARLIRDRGRSPMLAAADLQRPAAIDQLHVLGEQLGLPVYSQRDTKDAVAVCQNAVKHAAKVGADVVILDTAGRLHVDEDLMSELTRIDRRVQPQQVFLVTDGMTGQDAVNSAKAFNEALELDGVIMTKLDGDARGGALLSVKAVTGVPIKFIGVGEQLDALEEFHPERMAGRILGMGDMVGLFEKAQQQFDQDELAQQEERLRKGQFTLDDFKKMLSQTSRLGPMSSIMKMLPGMGQASKALEGQDVEGDLKRVHGIIDSMTNDERTNPTKTIDQSRRRRIAAGAGVEPHEVNDLVKQFDTMSDMMQSMAGLGVRDRMKKVKEMAQGGFLNPGSKFQKQKKGTGKRLSPREKAKLKKQREKDLRKQRRGSRSPGSE
jgi:signal recognition particle subunit SRP54